MVYIIKDLGKKKEHDKVIEEMNRNYEKERANYEEIRKWREEMSEKQKEIERELERMGLGLRRVEARSESDLDGRSVIGELKVKPEFKAKLYAIDEKGEIDGR
ncbi:MAG: hypothetical protein QXV73_03930 [Candidatus Micrarchaeia archaeon]